MTVVVVATLHLLVLSRLLGTEMEVRAQEVSGTRYYPQF